MTVSISTAGAAALILAPGLPLVLAMFQLIAVRSDAVTRLAPLGAIPALAAAFTALLGTGLDIDWILFGARFHLDEIGKRFLFFTGVIWFLGAGQLACSARRCSRRFATSFLLAMAGNMGVIVAADAATFYLFFALMSFAAYGLIVEDANHLTRRAGRVYIQLVVFGEVLSFAALALIVAESDPLDSVGFGHGVTTTLSAALVLVGFGIKAGLVPVHVSLPLAYSVAPSSARMVLAGAMLNAGVLGWLRFLPLESALPNWGEGLIVLGAISVLYGVVCGLGQENARALLAYSSVSQMGYVLMLFGVGFMNPESADSVRATLLLFLLHQALAKAALFWGYDLLGDGAGFRRFLAGSGLAMAAAALAGAPLTSGALAKVALAASLAPTEAILPGFVKYFLPAGAVATTLLMTRFLLLSGRAARGSQAADSVPPALYIVLIILVLGAAWYVGMPGLDRTAVIAPAKLWAGLWPVLLGLAVAGVGWTVVKIVPAAGRFRIPVGDLLVPVEVGSGALHSIWDQFSQRTVFLLFEIRSSMHGMITPLARRVIPSVLPWSSAATGLLLLMILFGLLGLILV